INRISVETSSASWWMKPFMVEAFGYLDGRGTTTPQLDCAVPKGFKVAELLIFLNRAAKLVPSLWPADPADRRVHPLAFSAYGHDDPFHQTADDGFPLLDLGARGVPQSR